jgi:hypothetical protein
VPQWSCGLDPLILSEPSRSIPQVMDVWQDAKSDCRACRDAALRRDVVGASPSALRLDLPGERKRHIGEIYQRPCFVAGDFPLSLTSAKCVKCWM